MRRGVQKRRSAEKAPLARTQTRSLANGHVRIYTYRSAYGKIPHVAWEEASMQGGFPLMEVSAIFCRCCTERVPNGVVFDQKGSQNGPKWSRKGAKSDQNGARREPKRGKGTYKGPPAEKYRFLLRKASARKKFLGAILDQNPSKSIKKRCRKNV